MRSHNGLVMAGVNRISMWGHKSKGNKVHKLYALRFREAIHNPRAALNRRQTFEGVKGVYVEPGATFVTLEGLKPGQHFKVELGKGITQVEAVHLDGVSVPFTVSKESAERLAKIELQHGRQPVDLSKLDGLNPHTSIVDEPPTCQWCERLIAVGAGTCTCCGGPQT